MPLHGCPVAACCCCCCCGGCGKAAAAAAPGVFCGVCCPAAATVTSAAAALLPYNYQRQSGHRRRPVHLARTAEPVDFPAARHRGGQTMHQVCRRLLRSTLPGGYRLDRSPIYMLMYMLSKCLAEHLWRACSACDCRCALRLGWALFVGSAAAACPLALLSQRVRPRARGAGSLASRAAFLSPHTLSIFLPHYNCTLVPAPILSLPLSAHHRHR